jgi:diadenosine tetraphosphate (Ap4A) HIT family hydrolase
MTKFTLDAKLENDSFFIANLDLSELRLINNSDYTWLILIPKINNLIEITDLSPQDYATLGKEIRELATIIQKEFNPDKLNIATIGNIVKQLHVHIVARYKDDKTFPKPVWGNEFIPYSKEELELKISKIAAAIRSRN